MRTPKKQRVGFALGGGGVHGAAEVGMLEALAEAGIAPSVIVGTSVGAINGAVIAAHADGQGVERLRGLWRELGASGVLGEGLVGRLSTLVRTRTHLHSLDPLRAVLERNLPDTFAQLRVPFQCVAASIERAGPRWFSEGPLVPAILASCAVPGLFPPVELGGEHHMDGGLVDSIPVGRALELGATELYVLQVGRIETPLAKPRNALEVALAAFEIGRRHRFVEEIESVPANITVHVLPAAAEGLAFNDLRQLRYRDGRRIGAAIERARDATRDYLAEGRSGG
jgi:NTE family protein